MRPLFELETVTKLEKCLYEARKELRRYWAGNLSCLPNSTSDYDSPNTANTTHDLACQKIILDSIYNAELEVIIFSEEKEHLNVCNHDERGEHLQILIDPLDGTHNAILGFPAFTTSVAAYYKDEYIFGWVYDISRDIVYTAAQGQGAYLQSPIIVKRLETRKVSRIEDMRIAFHRPSANADKRKIEDLMWSANKVRITSCSSLDICMIAAGTLDAFIDLGIPGHERSCDIAAAELILREAGGSLFYASGVARFSLPPSDVAVSDHGTLIALSSEKLIRLFTRHNETGEQ